jgi:hypothetical protein
MGVSQVINTGDELSLGLHLFRHYGNEALTRENDNITLKGARGLLNSVVNSSAYTGKGAAILLETSYQYIGQVDPSYKTAISAVTSATKTILNPIKAGKDFGSFCTLTIKSFF